MTRNYIARSLLESGGFRPDYTPDCEEPLNLLPYASALPRWVIFACAGAALLFLGMTWEKRLADLRRLGRATVRFG